MEKKLLYKILFLCFKKNFYPHKLFQKTLWMFCSDIKEIISKLKEIMENDDVLKKYKIVKIKENVSKEYDFLIYCKEQHNKSEAHK